MQKLFYFSQLCSSNTATRMELIDNIEDSELVVVVGDQLPFDSRLEAQKSICHSCGTTIIFT